jgi:hypothetical protein
MDNVCMCSARARAIRKRPIYVLMSACSADPALRRVKNSPPHARVRARARGGGRGGGLASIPRLLCVLPRCNYMARASKCSVLP